MNTRELTLSVGGMHCASCAKRVQVVLEHTPGVDSAAVSYNQKTVKIRCNSDVSLSELRRKVEQAGYTLSETPFRPSLFSRLWPPAVIALLYALLEHFGLLNYLVPSAISDGSTGYGALFLVGLMTSVHCIAMCGGISLTQSVAGLRQASEQWKPTLLYNLGRVLSYTLIGAVLGALGLLLSDLSIAPSYALQGSIKLIAGMVMLYMGLTMLGLLPAISLSHKKLPLPKRLLSPFGLGLLNGLMPCGPLQSVFLLSLASGGPIKGGLSMAFFALGTLPLMLGFGSLVGLLGQKYTNAVLLLGSVLICVLGLGMAGQGGTLADLFTPRQLLAAVLLFFGMLTLWQWIAAFHLRAAWMPMGAACFLAASLFLWNLKPASRNPAAAVLGEDGFQTITTQLDSGSYPQIQVQAGVPVRWIVQAEENAINGCNNRMLCQSLGLEYAFHPGENRIEFTPTAPGRYSYSCWMGMIYGTITVIQ